MVDGGGGDPEASEPVEHIIGPGSGWGWRNHQVWSESSAEEGTTTGRAYRCSLRLWDSPPPVQVPEDDLRMRFKHDGAEPRRGVLHLGPGNGVDLADLGQDGEGLARHPGRWTPWIIPIDELKGRTRGRGKD